MTRGQDKRKGWSAARSLLLLWSAIFVTMLSATVPLGPPASRTTGSAFSASTTVVAIRARAAQPVMAAPRLSPRPIDPPLAVMPLGLLFALSYICLTIVVVGPGRRHVGRAPLLHWRQPRAPPSSPAVIP